MTALQQTTPHFHSSMQITESSTCLLQKHSCDPKCLLTVTGQPLWVCHSHTDLADAQEWNSHYLATSSDQGSILACSFYAPAPEHTQHIVQPLPDPTC